LRSLDPPDPARVELVDEATVRRATLTPAELAAVRLS
jgi:hypothetical protein